MKNRARVGGHPVHPMLITIPIGALTISLVFDVVFLISGNPFWYAMAFWLIVAGIVGGLAAAVPGLIDYVTSVPAQAKSAARLHGLLNGGVIALYLVNAIIRATGPIEGARLGFSVVLSLLGVAGLMASGWLGGDLVYKYRMGIDEPPVPAAGEPEPPEVEEKRVA